MSRNNRHQDEGCQKQSGVPVPGDDERDRRQHDSGNAARHAGLEADDQVVDGRAQTDHQQYGECDRKPDDETDRQRAYQQGGGAYYAPDEVEYAVHVGVHRAFGRLGAREVHQRAAQKGKHEPKVVPAYVAGAGHCGPYGDQCRGGRIAPRQKRPSGVADHAAAGIFDHPPDERQTLGGVQLSVFHVCRISGLKLRIYSGCSSLFTGCLRVFCGVSAVRGAAVYSAAG